MTPVNFQNTLGKLVRRWRKNIMSTPTSVLVDTSIFDKLAYNFDSENMRAFIEVAKSKGVTLLLPDPIIREIQRHIRERAKAVITALQSAQRKAPFLKKWKEWPLKGHESCLHFALQEIAQKDWDDFLKNFEVIILDYSSIDLSQVMDWYDNQKAPFGKGEKRKEFPDAFAFAIVLDYVAEKDCAVAIVSADSDFKRCFRV